MRNIKTLILENIKDESKFFNRTLYMIKPVKLPTSMYKYIIENGRTDTDYKGEKQIKMLISLMKLKEHKSKKVKRFCATFLLKDFVDLEVIYVVCNLSNSITVHRRLIGLKTRLTI